MNEYAERTRQVVGSKFFVPILVYFGLAVMLISFKTRNSTSWDSKQTTNFLSRNSLICSQKFWKALAWRILQFVDTEVNDMFA